MNIEEIIMTLDVFMNQNEFVKSVDIQSITYTKGDYVVRVYPSRGLVEVINTNFVLRDDLEEKEDFIWTLKSSIQRTGMGSEMVFKKGSAIVRVWFDPEYTVPSDLIRVIKDAIKILEVLT